MIKESEIIAADEIISFIMDERTRTDDEWLDYAMFVKGWLSDPDVDESEKWKYRLSGFAEMLSMICSGISYNMG